MTGPASPSPGPAGVQSTPGPWLHAGHGHIWAQDKTSQHEAAVVQIAKVGAFHDQELLPFNRKRWTADAHVIASAPRMLEALEHLVMARRHSLDDCTCDDDCDVAIELWQTVDRLVAAALSAARGADGEP